MRSKKNFKTPFQELGEMRRTEKSGVRVAEKEESLCQKLSRRRAFLVGNKKGGPFTPLPSWKLYHHSANNTPPPAAVSARKLAAELWEFHHHHHHLAESNMQRSANSTNGRHHHRHRNIFRDKGIDLGHLMNDACPSSDLDQPESSSSLGRHIAQSLIKHHRELDRRNHALRPFSPTSYGSSMEVAPYDPAATPNSSLEFRGRVGDQHHNKKTSTELLKVLNRIWSLEEQHSSNISLIKALKTELGHSRTKIKELLLDQQTNHQDIDSLMNHIAEDKVGNKSKEQDYRIQSALQSVRDELEDERKLRKRSESLHKKLARELSETKSSLSSALKDLEKERDSRKLVEDLCDEFANAIKGYEQEVHFLKQKSEKDWTGEDDHNRMILHVAESWLDERMQMKLEEVQSGFAEKEPIADKLGFEIETFLQAKHNHNVLPRDRRNSLESVPLNEAVSAPQDMDAEDDSGNSDSNCFELNKPGNNDEINKSNYAETKPVSEVTVSRNIAKEEATPSSTYERKNEIEEIHGMSSSSVITVTDNAASSDHGTVRQWMTKFASPEIEASESSTKLAPGLKENTLKAKLLEARTKGSRTRLKVLRGKS